MSAITPARQSARGLSRRNSSAARRFGPWGLVAIGLILVALVAGAPNESEGKAFDPGSTTPSGTRALVLLLESFGARVDVTSEMPTDDTDVALLFVDALDEPGAATLERWVQAGGALVVTDPFSVFAPPVGGTTGAFGVAPVLERDVCNIAALADLGTADPGVAALFELGPTELGCFGDGEVAFVARQDLGDGSVTVLGGGGLFTNELLGEAENAAVAARLLVSEPGLRVALLQPGGGEGTSDRSLTDVISTGARLGIVQLFVAFLFYAWYRARRLGQPVLEPQPVEIAGSELVIAVGQLLQQTKTPNRAAALLRADLRRRIAERLGLPASMAPGDMAEVVAARTGIDEDRVRMAMTDAPVTTDAQLLELAQTIEAVREEILHAN